MPIFAARTGDHAPRQFTSTSHSMRVSPTRRSADTWWVTRISRSASASASTPWRATSTTSTPLTRRRLPPAPALRAVTTPAA